ncbi:hypothetical protein VZT92_016755 [Zoarces viviparus]|uniref:Actin filament-associated protein 1 n=1 Tax=Zoarces viviparus TaxID=48416 RepID=A0AAW1EPW5_ZOAVI
MITCAMDELVCELRLFLDLLDREYLSAGVREKKMHLSNILHRVLSDKEPSFKSEIHSGLPAPPQMPLPEIPHPWLPPNNGPPPLPSSSLPEGYYEEAVPLSPGKAPEYITANYDSDAMSSSYESYDEEEEDGKGQKMRHQWPSAEASMDLVKDARICAFLLRKKRFGQWTKLLCVIKDNKLLCYKSSKDHTPQMELTLTGCSITHIPKDGKKKKHELKIVHQGADALVLAVHSKEQAEEWLKVMREVCVNGSVDLDRAGSGSPVHKPELEKASCDRPSSDGEAIHENGQSDCKDQAKGKKNSKSEQKTGTVGKGAGKKITKIIGLGKKKPSTDEQNSSAEEEVPSCGYLNVLSNNRWRERWCRLKDNQLLLHKDRDDLKSHIASLPLRGCEVSPGLDHKHPFAFRLLRNGQEVAVLEASSSEEMGRWLGILLAETGSTTDPATLHYDYIDVETTANVIQLAKQSFCFTSKRAVSPNPYLDNPVNGYACPTGVALHYDDVPINGTAGSAVIEPTAGGPVIVPTAGGPVIVPTADGPVIEPTAGGPVIVPTAGGPVIVPTAGGPVIVPTAGGPVIVPTAGGPVIEPTAGGPVIVPTAGGPVIVPTAGGPVIVPTADGPVIEPTAGGPVIVPTAGGPVIVPTAGGPVIVPTAGGPVIEPTAGGPVIVPTAGGPVIEPTAGGPVIEPTAGGPVIENTAGGPVIVPTAGGPVIVPTAGGPVIVPTAGGPVIVPTAGGPVIVPTADGPVIEPTAGGPVIVPTAGGPGAGPWLTGAVEDCVVLSLLLDNLELVDPEVQYSSPNTTGCQLKEEVLYENADLYEPSSKLDTRYPPKPSSSSTSSTSTSHYKIPVSKFSSKFLAADTKTKVTVQLKGKKGANGTASKQKTEPKNQTKNNGVNGTNGTASLKRNGSNAEQCKYGKNRVEADAKRLQANEEELMKKKQEIRNHLTQLKKERIDLRTAVEAAAGKRSHASLSERLKKVEEDCRQREEQRVNLELELSEVKESLKKALSGGVTLGLTIEPKTSSSGIQSPGTLRRAQKSSSFSSCDTSDTESCSLPVNSASLLRRQQGGQKASPVRGHVLRKAKEWEQKTGT